MRLATSSEYSCLLPAGSINVSACVPQGCRFAVAAENEMHFRQWALAAVLARHCWAMAPSCMTNRGWHPPPSPRQRACNKIKQTAPEQLLTAYGLVSFLDCCQRISRQDESSSHHHTKVLIAFKWPSVHVTGPAAEHTYLLNQPCSSS